MKTSTILVWAAVVCFLAAGNGQAQVYQSPQSPNATGRLENSISLGGKYQDYIYGVVQRIEKNELILDKTTYGNDQVFKLQRNTKFIHNGKHSTLSKLKIGDMVWIDAKIKKKTGEKIARKVITGVPSAGNRH